MDILFIIILLILYYLLALALSILNIIATWIIFKKAGRKGWESLIPFYNVWIFTTKIANLNWWWILIYLSSFLIILLPLFNQSLLIILLTIMLITSICYLSAFVCFYNIAKKFNHKTIDAIGMLLIPTIMFPIMAFSKNWIYDSEIKVSKNGPFKD